VILIGLAIGGCYRTHYTNLYALDYVPAEPPTGRVESEATWRNFWIYGWSPGEMKIDAAAVCGEGHVDEIETKRSFLQGLVAGLASVYINIYSPWTGKIRCSESQ
jgi:hypothetical protein